MAGRAGWLRGWLAVGVVSAIAAAQPVWGQDAADASTRGSRLRAADAHAATLLAMGAARSATFREIVEAIEQTDLIVYIEARPMDLPGQLQLLAATPVGRYVRVAVRAPGLDKDQIAWLAHELWHAVEIATAPEIRDQSSLRQFYKRIGAAGPTDKVESASAQEVWTKVIYEMRSLK